MVSMLNACLSSECVPNECKNLFIVPLDKGKGDPLKSKKIDI